MKINRSWLYVGIIVSELFVTHVIVPRMISRQLSAPKNIFAKSDIQKCIDNAEAHLRSMEAEGHTREEIQAAYDEELKFLEILKQNMNR